MKRGVNVFLFLHNYLSKLYRNLKENEGKWSINKQNNFFLHPPPPVFFFKNNSRNVIYLYCNAVVNFTRADKQAKQTIWWFIVKNISWQFCYLICKLRAKTKKKSYVHRDLYNCSSYFQIHLKENILSINTIFQKLSN